MAIGLRKPICLLSIETVNLPSYLAGFQNLSTDLNDEKLLSFQIDLFLRTLGPKGSPKRSKQLAPKERLQLANIPSPKLFGSALEQTVAAAIHRAGGRVTIPTRIQKEHTPDLLMWLPQADKELFNPAAIEVRGPVKTRNLADVQLRFASFIQTSGLRCGLIIINSHSLEKRISKLFPIPFIFVLTLPISRRSWSRGNLLAG
jgi:hypothetical protein